MTTTTTVMIPPEKHTHKKKPSLVRNTDFVVVVVGNVGWFFRP
jgi:hypothetical protein